MSSISTKNICFNKKILIIDDSPVVRQVIREFLLGEGYLDVRAVACGREAFCVIPEQETDLALLDYHMPEMNGDEVLDRLRAEYPDLVVIMLSDQSDKNLIVSLMRKADDYIVKEDIRNIKGELLHIFRRCFAIQDLRRRNSELLETLSQRNRQLEKELNMARSLQKEIFPEKIESSRIFDIDVVSKPSATIGGDYFNVVRLDSCHVGIFISDICGHGLQAALLSFTLSNAFKHAIREGMRGSAVETVQELNILLTNRFPPGSFATGIYLVLDEDRATVSFSGAFETPILYCRQDGEINQLINGNVVFLGLVDNHLVRFEEETIILQPGEKIFAFTDGLVEVKNKAGERFSLARVKQILLDTASEPVHAVCDRLYRSSFLHGQGNITDDVTIVGIQHKGLSRDKIR